MTYPKLQRDLFQNDGAGSKLNESLLPDGLIKVSAQSFTTDQKAQARTNIGAISYESQSLTTAQQKQALSNIGAVSYLDNTLTEAQAIQTLKNLKFDVGSAAFANSIWGGRNILDMFTQAEFDAKVAAGDFSGLFVGDYIEKTITVSGTAYTRKWLCMDFCYFCNSGAVPEAHIVMMPESCCGNAQMNSTNTTEGAYVDSAMWKTTMPLYASAIQAAFGSAHVLAHNECLGSAISTSMSSAAGAGLTGATTAATWTSTLCNIPNEAMIFGAAYCSSSYHDVEERNSQLAGFRLKRKLLQPGVDVWLSAVCNSSRFCCCSSGCRAYPNSASYSNGVLPYFLYH